MNIEVSVVRAEQILEEALGFYRTHESAANINPDDRLVIARDGLKMLGCVRLCQEADTLTLRSMLVRKDFRHLGVGRKILQQFSSLLNEHHVASTYCIPYAHLEKFYGLIGFKKVIEENVPAFLQDRIASYRLKRPDTEFIIMFRELS